MQSENSKYATEGRSTVESLKIFLSSTRLSRENIETIGLEGWADTLMNLANTCLGGEEDFHMDEELPRMSLESVSDCLKIRQHLSPGALAEVVSGIRCLHPFIEVALLDRKISREMRDFLREYMFFRDDLLKEALDSSKNSNDESVGSSGGGDTSGSNERDAATTAEHPYEEDKSENEGADAATEKTAEDRVHLWSGKEKEEDPGDGTNTSGGNEINVGECVNWNDDNRGEYDLLSEDETFSRITRSRSRQEAAQAVIGTTVKRRRAVTQPTAELNQRDGDAIILSGEKRCERCRGKNIDACITRKDGNNKTKACDRCHRLKAMCTYANDGKGRVTKADNLRLVPSTTPSHDLVRSKVQVEVVVPTIASIRQTKYVRSLKDNDCSPPVHKKRRGDDKPPSSTSLPSPAEDHGVQSKTSRDILSVTRSSQSLITQRPESPLSGADKLRAQVSPYRQDLLVRIAATKAKVFLEEVEVTNANMNLEAARNCERLLTGALAKLDKGLEQNQFLDIMEILSETDEDIRVSDSKETSEIATRGHVVE